MTIQQTPLGEIDAEHIPSDKCKQICWFCYHGFHQCVNKKCECREEPPLGRKGKTCENLI